MNQMNDGCKDIILEALEVSTNQIKGDIPTIISTPSGGSQLPKIGPDQDNISVVGRMQEVPYSDEYLADLNARLNTAIEKEMESSPAMDITITALKAVSKLLTAVIL